MNKLIGLFIIGSIMLLGACTTQQSPITNFEECMEAGHGVMESYPRKCSVNGETFVEEIEQQIPSENATTACTMEYAPVCGVDGATYGNECMAQDVEIAYEGECIEENSTELNCTEQYAPVCGVDGATYPNKCHAGDIDIAYEGECGEENAFNNSRVCTKEYMPVCGADGVTYGNSCEAGDMMIVHEGACEGDE